MQQTLFILRVCTCRDTSSLRIISSIIIHHFRSITNYQQQNSTHLNLDVESLGPPSLLSLFSPLLLLGLCAELVTLLLGLDLGITGGTSVLVGGSDSSLGLVGNLLGLSLELLPLRVSEVLWWLLREELKISRRYI